MVEKESEVYISPTKGEMGLVNVMAEIAQFVADKPDILYTLAIGTDSQVKNIEEGVAIGFVTAIVIHGEGRGGRYFYRKSRSEEIMPLRKRMWTEAMMSLALAQKLVEGFSYMLDGLPISFEIHIDVGRNGKTNTMVTEVLGAVKGNGFNAVIKPDSFASSSVADLHT